MTVLGGLGELGAPSRPELAVRDRNVGMSDSAAEPRRKPGLFETRRRPAITRLRAACTNLRLASGQDKYVAGDDRWAA